MPKGMPSSDFSGLPFAAGSVKGIRSFGVTVAGRLTGVFRGEYSWSPYENTAECVWGGGGETGHPIGSDGCMCGFWAYAANDETQEYVRGSERFALALLGRQLVAIASGGRVLPTIPGAIEAYGSVMLGTRGFRAEKAKVIALVDESLAPVSLRTRLAIRWHRWATKCHNGGDFQVPMRAGQIAGAVGVFTLVTGLFGTPWLVGLGVFLLGLTFVLFKAIHDGISYRYGRKPIPSRPLPHPEIKLIRKNYTDVTWYPSIDAMVADLDIYEADKPERPESPQAAVFGTGAFGPNHPFSAGGPILPSAGHLRRQAQPGDPYSWGKLPFHWFTSGGDDPTKGASS